MQIEYQALRKAVRFAKNQDSLAINLLRLPV